MTQADVLAFLEFTDDLGIVPWLAGGWGADAECGTQTRPHSDLDLFLDARDAATLAQHLALRGFTARVDQPWHVTYVDSHDREIDVRLFERDGAHLTHGPDERWPASVLDGYGLIGTRTVRRLLLPW
jgi:lincosamide nucleotidyltransferase A/C/D/E